MKRIILLEIISWILIVILISIHLLYKDNLYILYIGLIGYIVNIITLITIGLIVIVNLFYYNKNY